MNETRIKSALMLIGEGLVIWYGMGTPIPTNVEDTIKLVVAILAIVYTGWKNHDFTVEGDTGTKITREMKELRDHVPMTVDEPEDSHIVESESEVQNGDE